ncbi:MAG: hypothetical protein LBM26_00875 [Methanobrevibacter sp.]|jgi:hypothetical protein|nr:hypothetical protein [Methanobrevibacter sp.]
MPRILKIILILILFVGFFEAGLLSSYTIITSEAPDVKGLIDLQIETISGIFSSENVNGILIKDPVQINISNVPDVANKIASITGLDGVDLDNMNVSTYNGANDENIQVTITALGFSSPKSTKGQIVLSQTPDFLLTANATANRTSSGVVVNVDSIQINSILKLYNQTQ